MLIRKKNIFLLWLINKNLRDWKKNVNLDIQNMLRNIKVYID